MVFYGIELRFMDLELDKNAPSNKLSRAEHPPHSFFSREKKSIQMHDT